MSEMAACAVCGEPTEAVTFPVRVVRGGQEVLRVMVAGRACSACGWLDVPDEVRERLIATLDAHTEPGDDIVFPQDTPAH